MRHPATNIQNNTATIPAKVQQDVDCYAAEIKLGKSVLVFVPKGRQAYLLCVEGALELNGYQQLERHDGAEIVGVGGCNRIFCPLFWFNPITHTGLLPTFPSGYISARQPTVQPWDDMQLRMPTSLTNVVSILRATFC